MLIQLMADQGDPRSPALGELKPRQPASPAQLADPAQYRAFEDQHSRDQIMAYASGVQQIPAIRERIEHAAQSGERNAAGSEHWPVRQWRCYLTRHIKPTDFKEGLPAQLPHRTLRRAGSQTVMNKVTK